VLPRQAAYALLLLLLLLLLHLQRQPDLHMARHQEPNV
jgi:hypothetical protein